MWCYAVVVVRKQEEGSGFMVRFRGGVELGGAGGGLVLFLFVVVFNYGSFSSLAMVSGCNCLIRKIGFFLIHICGLAFRVCVFECVCVIGLLVICGSSLSL